jgi:hypothetical protein
MHSQVDLYKRLLTLRQSAANNIGKIAMSIPVNSSRYYPINSYFDHQLYCGYLKLMHSNKVVI